MKVGRADKQRIEPEALRVAQGHGLPGAQLGARSKPVADTGTVGGVEVVVVAVQDGWTDWRMVHPERIVASSPSPDDIITNDVRP